MMRADLTFSSMQYKYQNRSTHSFRTDTIMNQTSQITLQHTHTIHSQMRSTAHREKEINRDGQRHGGGATGWRNAVRKGRERRTWREVGVGDQDRMIHWMKRHRPPDRERETGRRERERERRKYSVLSMLTRIIIVSLIQWMNILLLPHLL